MSATTKISKIVAIIQKGAASFDVNTTTTRKERTGACRPTDDLQSDLRATHLAADWSAAATALRSARALQRANPSRTCVPHVSQNDAQSETRPTH